MAWHIRTHISALLLATFWSSLSYAYPTPVDFSGRLLRWDVETLGRDISYVIEADDSSDLLLYGDLVDESAELWNSVASANINLVPAAGEADAMVTVRLRRSIDGSDVSAGYAYFDEYDDNGFPLHCVTEVLVGQSGYLSLAKTILHELGHCLGLGHSLVPQAIMSYQLDRNTFALDIDDQAALTRLYPANGSAAELPPGCSLVIRHRSAPAWGVLMLLLWPLMMMGLSRGRPQRAQTIRSTQTRYQPYQKP